MTLSPLKKREITTSGTLSQTEVETSQPTKTYKLDLVNGTIKKTIDDTEAIKQFVEKALRTSRNRFKIYDNEYGSDLDSLIGEDLPMEYLQAEIPRIVREAIVYDERIDDVTNFQITRESSDLYVSFTVVINAEATKEKPLDNIIRVTFAPFMYGGTLLIEEVQ